MAPESAEARLLGRQGAIIYLRKVLLGCYFFINNFLWAQMCPQAMASPWATPASSMAQLQLQSLGLPLGARDQAISTASTLICPVSQKAVWSAAPALAWPLSPSDTMGDRMCVASGQEPQCGRSLFGVLSPPHGS